MKTSGGKRTAPTVPRRAFLLLGFYALIVTVWAAIVLARADRPEAGPEQMAVAAENRLMKQMLGQVDGWVIPLGPAGAGGAHGKIAWDTTLQAGYVHLAAVPATAPGESYRLHAVTTQGTVFCGELNPPGADGRINQAFRPRSRLIHPEGFLVKRAPASAAPSGSEGESVAAGRLPSASAGAGKDVE